jgi:RND family efflux transporter MFP subunit
MMANRFTFSPSRRNLGLAALVLAGGAAAYWFGFARPPSDKPKQSVEVVSNRPVLVQKVTLVPTRATRVLVGTVRARVEADQGFRIAGKVAERLVQAGDRVKKGQVLARIDASDLSLQRETAEAELAAAKASERSAAAELGRVTELRQKGWSTEQILDRQRAALEEATGRRLRAEGSVELARNAQSYSELKAEADGIVLSASLEPGQVVAAGQGVFRLARDGDREAQVAVPEQDIDDLPKARAEASLWTDPTQSRRALLRELSPSADPATRTFQARFSLPDLAADAPLGMTVTVSLKPEGETRLARVPLSALLNEGKGVEVYVVNGDGELKRRSVEIRSLEAREALVVGGLSDGDQVVILGIHTLKPGQRVRAVTELRLG